ncbi:hypothetical protein HN51_006809 [Arachis hypogaea]|uniref:Uncharacterized protein LOC110281445 n=2 Tax=Arachis TaxID=3817 RepID=A0A6P5NWU1_ARADU|nr:uncharacterized protein LOC110281445 [Arachis duranensis]XP_025702532.1 uncharacterized protein LOC112803237 [Arachis hypogaea]QHO40798.1 uncharacterized protein DS421_5g140240 [Arachis hypogaea]
MGACASSHSHSKFPTTPSKTKAPSSSSLTASKRRDAGVFESFRRPSSIMVMDMEGKGIREYPRPIPASHVVSETPGCFLCNSESLHVGTCMPRVPDDEDLLPGRIYFLVPASKSREPLTLPLLCDLAVKASSALAAATTNSVQRR